MYRDKEKIFTMIVVGFCVAFCSWNYREYRKQTSYFSYGQAFAAGNAVEIPLEEQAEIIRSLGIQVDDRLVEEQEAWLAENEWLREYAILEPYKWLLGAIGFGEWNDDYTEWTPSDQVYSFDFEGWDISTDYIDILTGIQAIGKEEIEFTQIKEDVDAVNWERGTGYILVEFCYNNQPYKYKARMDNDWIDSGFLTFVGDILQKQDNGKRLYFMYDGGQGAIVFYNTKDWAKEFTKKTGLELKTSW